MQNSLLQLYSIIFATLAIFLSGCVPTETRQKEVLDGAPKKAVDASSIPDAVPKPHIGSYKFSSYELDGVVYKPLKSANGYKKEGTASWYGTKFHGKKTANGEVYDMYKMTAAHKRLPLPSYVKVTNLSNNRSVVLRVNDRGPFHGDRLIDVSYVAAKKLGFANDGTSRVKIEGIDPESFRTSKKPTKEQPLVYLQLAALKSYQRAEVMQRRVYDRLGVNAIVLRADKKDNPDHAVYRVRVGPVESPEQMERWLEDLEEARFDTPFIVYE